MTFLRIVIVALGLGWLYLFISQHDFSRTRPDAVGAKAKAALHPEVAEPAKAADLKPTAPDSAPARDDARPRIRIH